MEIRVFKNKDIMGVAAAERVGETIKTIVKQKGYARVIFATGASQFSFLSALVQKPNIPWNKVEAFHLDEYVGISDTHPASFRLYLNKRLFNKVTPKFNKVHLLNEKNLTEYSQLLLENEIDLACIGIGENGHIAFNDPPVADFNDTKQIKIVELDEECRQQQVGEGWFPSLNDVPTHAITLTIPAIMRSKCISVVVPDSRKYNAVVNTLYGKISTKCPASVLRQHRHIILWLDEHSAPIEILQQMYHIPMDNPTKSKL
eukprot:234640_1